MFLQSSAPSCTSWGKEDRAATTRTPRAFQAREEWPGWLPSSGVRRWAWGSSSCRWRLPTAAWLSSGSWGWSSSEMWVVPGWHAELLQMCPRVCLSFPQSTWERRTCREAKKSMVRVGFPQGWSEIQTSHQDPTHPWVPTQCSGGPSVTPAVTAKLWGRPPAPGPWGSPRHCPAVGTSQTQWCLPSTPRHSFSAGVQKWAQHCAAFSPRLVFPPVFSWMWMSTASRESLWMKWEGANPWRESCVSKRLSNAIGFLPTGGVGFISLSALTLGSRISGKMVMFSSEPLEMFSMRQLITTSPHMGNNLLPLFWKWLTELKTVN